MLKEDLSVEGVMFFVSVVVVLRDVWIDRLYALAAFHYESLYHLIFDGLNLALVLFLCLQIEATKYMKNPEADTAFTFTITLLAIKCLTLMQTIEISYVIRGDINRGLLSLISTVACYPCRWSSKHHAVYICVCVCVGGGWI